MKKVTYSKFRGFFLSKFSDSDPISAHFLENSLNLQPEFKGACFFLAPWSRHELTSERFFQIV